MTDREAELNALVSRLKNRRRDDMNYGHDIERKLFELKGELQRREKCEEGLEEIKRLLGIGDNKGAYEVVKKLQEE
jgi:hypothetical protein